MIGKHIIRLEETDSTNLYAERLLQQGQAGHGTVVTAAYQSDGKGQGDNTWESEKGKNLLVTFILEPVFLPASEQFMLNKAMTLAACDLVRASGVVPSVKWPNDIYAADKKTAGLLISHRVAGSTLEYSVVGMGINLNQEKFPASLPNAVSLKMLTGVEYDPSAVLESLITAIVNRYGQLSSGTTEEIDREYLASLRGVGEWRMYRLKKGMTEGRIAGVDEFGRLILTMRNGRTELFSHGELTF